MQSLFESQVERPLADRMRPEKLDDVVGQEHIVGPEGLVRKLLKGETLPSLIFWGPPGSGKTTLARIIASESGNYFAEVSAVSMGKADIKRVVDEASRKKSVGERTILFVDEIHRFNKAQQDVLLPYVEDGTVILIGATTENPSFEVISPLLSRSTLIVLNPISEEDLLLLVQRGATELDKKINKKTAVFIAHQSAGDARAALGGLETAAKLAGATITLVNAQQAMQTVGLKYDKGGDDHYNTISAFIKSMRGSDAEAALFYLHRMLAAGEDPKFIARRIIIFASEDIGMASPHALTLAVSAFQAIERIGLPEGEYVLSQAVVAMAQADKSRAVTDAMHKAKKQVADFPGAQIPVHLRNAPTKLMKELGYAENYEWKADFKHKKGFLPEELRD